MRLLGLGLLGVCLLGSVAFGEDYEATGGTEQAYKHGGQFKIYSQVGIGYRLIYRYDTNDYCGQAMQTQCRDFTAPWIEVGAGYGVTDSFEILTDLRFGLSGEFAPPETKAPKMFVISPGVRVFIDDAGSIKFFTTFQLAIDRTDYKGVKTATDFGVRNVNGLLVDLHRTFGIYAHIGETVGFARWLRFEIDGGLGMMVRLP